MTWRITDPAQLLEAMRAALARGGEFLVGRIAPRGPVLRERSVSYVHKTVWGMYAAGVDHAVIARLLDWVESEALRPSGDFYFDEEPPAYKDFQRVYRPLTFGKVAAWTGHPVVRRPRVLDRILQHWHAASGGCFHYIGDDPARPETPATVGTLNTTFFGQLMVALDMRREALGAAEWVRRWVEANRGPMAAGQLFSLMTPEGRLITDAPPGTRLARVTDTRAPKQEFWNAGTAMAYLALVYDVMQDRWGEPEEKARPYLEAALALLDFETAMPLETCLWPSKCKVGWGAGELLRVLVKHRPGDAERMERAYRVAERVAVFTFLDNQLAHGGWAPMHYPLDERAPELRFSYKPVGGEVRVPPGPIEGSTTVFLPAEEISGEFLGELKAVEQGVAAWIREGRPV